MPRPPHPEASLIDPVDPAALASLSESANAMALMNQERNAAAQAIALQLGYEGSLAVGALEDEIRFYQRRTVESLLELGKRLLVLKELTPHGQFEQRVEMLGFSYRSAARFMQAAIKTSKSANLALLSSQVKSASAFLELVTHDDDTLDALVQMDEIDRMSATQLRQTLRDLHGDLQAKDKVLDDAHRKLTDLQVQMNKKVVAQTDWPDALSPLTDQIAAAGRKLAQAAGELENCRITLFSVAEGLPEAQRSQFETALAHVAEVYEQALARGERDLVRERATFEKTLGAYAPQPG
ncbi:hypothetical protein G5B88_01115 [Herbaspirillum seropedicae]|uniref:DUF3102 domain-containing protein n=1 Tax=Herbaspirillum seropedicae (strain SmR1) TaxID=757424 RepID=D8IV32_HERSS|nr:hypothetical protein [Herbaspirillum seropedicae]ADJ61751.1 hypothetical protein Hsero_0225 [Herbaspirillum seropedicae SmR1]UMU19863.1 hypothetical protein G5B88_01115 [Herbaspirillum seropedicae]